MRLIDADRLTAYMNDYALQVSPFGHIGDSDYNEKLAAYVAITNCITMVEDAETVRRGE